MKMVTVFYKGNNGVWKRDLVENPYYRSFIDYKPFGSKGVVTPLSNVINFYINNIIIKLAIEDRKNSKGYTVEPDAMLLKHIVSLYGALSFKHTAQTLLESENDINVIKSKLKSSISRMMAVSINIMYLEHYDTPLFGCASKDAINKANMLLVDNMIDTFNIDGMMEVIMEFKELYDELKEQEKEG